MNLPKEFPKFDFALDHIGIAVESLEEGFKFYKALGAQSMPVEVVESEKVKVGFVNLQNSCSLELLEPVGVDSPIRKFLERRGPGIHHICLRVKGIDAIAESLKSAGIRLINDIPRPGAHGCRIIFVHPASAGGVLLEISDPGVHSQ